MRGRLRLQRIRSEATARLLDKASGSRRKALAHRLLRVSSFTRAAHWYRPTSNFGDCLAPEILRAVHQMEPTWVRASFAPKVVGLGSILHRAAPGDVVWGTGLIDDRPFDGRGIRFEAVRGPRTRACITGDVPEVYGDPGLLMPTIYTPAVPARRDPVGLILHRSEKDLFSEVTDPHVRRIDVEAPWPTVIDAIVSCDVVVSSALHGIIVAESYGVPAVWIQPTDRLQGGWFKFLDYYEGTDRDPLGPAPWPSSLRDFDRLATQPPAFDTDPLRACTL